MEKKIGGQRKADAREFFYRNEADELWALQRKEYKMKGYKSLTIFCAVLLFGAILISPAFADMDKVADKELGQTQAYVKGSPSKDTTNETVKDAFKVEKEIARDSHDKGELTPPPAESKKDTVNYQSFSRRLAEAIESGKSPR
ncbi:MAG: hypothetical protein ABFD63_11670 [Smithella sp.]|jgi:hypothetical protein